MTERPTEQNGKRKEGISGGKIKPRRLNPEEEAGAGEGGSEWESWESRITIENESPTFPRERETSKIPFAQRQGEVFRALFRI